MSRVLMPDPSLAGRRILVVEDEYFLAVDLERELTEAGAVVIGPAASVEYALELIENEPRLDAAVLDINLGGEMSYPVADALTTRFVPFLFATGYNAQDIPARYASVTRCEKPILPGSIAREIGSKVASG